MKQFIGIKEVLKKIRTRSLLLPVLVTSFWSTVNAQYDGGIPDGHNSAVIGVAAGPSAPVLQAGATVSVPCPAGNIAEIISARRIVNIVRLYLFEESAKYLSTDFTVSVPVKIEYGPNSSSLHVMNTTLTVNYHKGDGVKYDAKNYVSFEGAEYVKITVTGNVNPLTAGGVNLADVLILENEMKVTRYFELQPGVTPTSLATSIIIPFDGLGVDWNWPHNAGNNATQLEWTWLEDELKSVYYIPNTTTVDIEKLFKNNATRLDLPLSINSFKIPVFYDGEGDLYFRIRPVNIKADGSRSDGQWTIPVSGDGIFHYEGHNNDLNWQVRTSFAEDGKMKSVMEYYDGTLRSRQTVTKENVHNTTVTAETFYDYEGRPAIQILPAPGMDQVIQYQANLNLFNSPGAANHNPAEFFDLSLNTASGADLYATKDMAENTGAAKYYSEFNGELNSGPNKNIPKAEGYPYTVTRYMDDATGRIAVQSGVGAAHKMGSDRETKYYYGSPSQEELDGLFGTEVGYKSHYFKNMVKDANGQMSISYTDMHGRTIITALAGPTPGNLLPINNNDQVNYPHQQGTSITTSLLDNNTNIVKGNAIESISTLLVPDENLYTFKYKLTPESFNLNSCDNTPVCYDCLYDLEISIADESGDKVPWVYTYKNLTVSGDVDNDCNTNNPFVVVCSGCPAPVNNEISIPQTLLPGSYTIRKTLTLSESSLQKYKELFYQAGNGICNKTQQALIDSVYQVLLATSDCNAPVTTDCTNCLQQLGEYSAFRNDYLVSIGNPSPVPPALDAEIQAAFNTQVENCNRLCNSTVSQVLNGKRQQMLADMMPYGGQYATEAPISTVNGTTMYVKYNIFSTDNTSLQPFYKKPWGSNQQMNFYRDDVGEIDLLIHPGGTTDNYIFLNSLTKNQFTSQFVNSWAEALLPHHPEYPRLLYAEGTLAAANVYNWISLFNSKNTYAEAASAGYIMTTEASITDPFYTVASSLKPQMAGWINNIYVNGLSMWQVARAQVLCPNAANMGSCISGTTNKVPPFTDINTDDLRDRLWQTFRSIYAAAREKQVNDHIVAQRPLADDADLISQGFQLRFGTNQQTVQQTGGTWYPPSIGAPPTGIGSTGVPPTGIPPSVVNTQTYTSRCQGYIDQWKQSLLQCGPLKDKPLLVRNLILDQIISGMISVCERGSDAANPYGSSTVPVHVDGQPDSFEEVIRQVYAQYHITPPSDYYCNPYVIEFPKPYGKNPRFYQDYTPVVDSCACGQFNTISTAATTAGYNPTSLSSINEYLQLNYQETLTPVMHQALLNCSQYHQTVCDTFQHAITAYCYDPGPCDVQCAFRIQHRQTGKSQFKLAQPETCADWQSLISCFYDLFSDSVGTGHCQSLFTSMYNGYYQPSLTWTQIANLYLATCEQPLNVCSPCTTTVLCTDSMHCREVFRPYYLSSPQPLPEFLKCGGKPKTCLSCDSLVNLTTRFKTIYFASPYNAGPHFTATDLDDIQLKQNVLYARFLNFYTGYQYTWMQYAQAAAASNCNALAGLGGVADLVVTSRSGNVPTQYIASNSITFLPAFESGVDDEFETLIQPNGSGGGPQIVICPNMQPLNDTTGIFVIDAPCEKTRILSVALAQTIYQQQLLAAQANFESGYRAKCMAAKDIESFKVTYECKEYHYTLYYYDMAGNLVKTVPPKGVNPDYSPQFLDDVKAARNSCRNDDVCASPAITPSHSFATSYRYNSLGLVVEQKSPDASTDTKWSKFWYDNVGRLVVSQNAQQALDNKYSYTIYDALGRSVEVGQKPQTNPMSQGISQDPVNLKNWIEVLTGGGTYREQITYTGYDAPFGVASQTPNGIYFGAGLDQRNLRNRVSYTYTKNFENDQPPCLFYTGTFYTYDIHGNVDTLLQDFCGVVAMNTPTNSNRHKRIVYDYDLISGKVNRVSYQGDWYRTAGPSPGWQHNTDKFFHVYKYDAENRLTEVMTSRDSITWERDAVYDYYKYGPLSRTLLGQLQVQGIDYAYTIQGWIKGVNSTSVGDGSFDMGGDGLIVGGINVKVARDIYGFALHYFDNGAAEMDYKPIGNTSLFARPNNNAFVSLYNGNIAAMSVNNAGLLKGPAGTTNALPLFNNYRYDELNRIRSMTTYKGLSNSNQWVPVPLSLNNDYGESVTYDPNGNILTYNRNAAGTVTAPSGFSGGVPMDQMTYEYYPNSNRLKKVIDAVPAGAWDNDINTQDDPAHPDNYIYDAIGNLKTDYAEHITNISWTVYGKISSIIKENGSSIVYTYDASGNRITKTVHPPSGSQVAIKTTVYVRDASGKVMSIYEGEEVSTQWTTKQIENHLYGISRLGIATELTVPETDADLQGGYGKIYTRTFTRGEKSFELSNHLGNVLVTISDKRIAFDIGSNGVIDYYEADVITASDYYPFGMMMPGRKYSANGSYRYGFNGKENDNDVKGEGNQQDYGLRIYDPRLGKFLSVDPLTKSYAMLTPYQFASNSPVWCIDLDGGEGKTATDYFVDLMNWLGRSDNEWDNINRGEGPIGEKLASFNRNINPVGVVWYNGYAIVTARDFDTGEPVPGGRLGAFSTLGVNVMMYLTGEKFISMFGVTPWVETQMNFNKTAIGSSTIRTESNAFGTQWGAESSFAVENRTTSLLGTNEGYLPTRINGSQNIVANEANPGGFSYLNANLGPIKIDLTTLAGRDYFWYNFNKPYIDKIIARGDKIALTDNPFDVKSLFFQGDINNGLNFFGREIEYLNSLGYTFADGLAIPPPK